MATICKAIVKSVKQYGEDVREYILLPDKYNFFDPGSFLQLSLEEPQCNQWPESRNFSIASFLNEEKTIRLIIRKVGYYTTRIFDELLVDSVCYIKYSFGDFLLPFYDKESPIVCIAGGTGIAPFLSFAEYLESENKEGRLHLFYSAKSIKELIGESYLNNLLCENNLSLHLTREKNRLFKEGRITINHILKNIKNINKAHFYICGGEDFTQKFKNELIAAGAENVYSDEW
nr:FAD-dependent oxidoreductase [uncultured Carboxylicivirga sp.]